jgi:hypothetical protein
MEQPIDGPLDPLVPRLPNGRFSGRNEFQQMLRNAFAAAAREGWQEIIVSDADFRDWPLGERSVVDALVQWSRAGKRFTMLARTYDDVTRRHARFVTWRRTWDHIITCRRVQSAGTLEMPSTLWSASWMMNRIDAQRCVGIAGRDPSSQVFLKETLDEWIRCKSSSGFPATTLGL